MIATKEEEIIALRTGGHILASVLAELVENAVEGTNTAALDLMAERSIRARGGVPSFLNYKPEGAALPFPATLCVSINDEVVHGIPNEERVLRRGDIVSLDLGLSYDGYFVDAARTVVVGGADSSAQRLITATEEALRDAIAAARAGGRIGDIGAAIVQVAHARKFGVVEELGGHAVGAAVHERPFIANDGRAGQGEKIVEGMVLAIEPMLAEGKGAIELDADDWTYRMADGKRAAHVEDTILVTKNGAEILTV